MTAVIEGVNADWAQVGRATAVQARRSCAAANSHRPSFGQRIIDADPPRCEISMETARTVFDAVAHHLTVELTVTADLNA